MRSYFVFFLPSLILIGSAAYAGERTVGASEPISFEQVIPQASRCAERVSVSRHKPEERIVDRIHALNVSEEIKQRLLARLQSSGVFGRIRIHVVRMLEERRSFEENQFGLAVLFHFREAMNTFRDPFRQDALETMLQGENANNGMFWTLGPYLYDGLRAEGDDELTALRRMLLWAEAAVQRNANYPFVIHLPGLSEQNWYGTSSLFYLEGDPNHLTNRYALQEARRLLSEGVIPRVSAE